MTDIEHQLSYPCFVYNKTEAISTGKAYSYALSATSILQRAVIILKSLPAKMMRTASIGVFKGNLHRNVWKINLQVIERQTRTLLTGLLYLELPYTQWMKWSPLVPLRFYDYNNKALNVTFLHSPKPTLSYTHAVSGESGQSILQSRQFDTGNWQDLYIGR